MSAQSNTEKVLRSLHVLLSKSEPYPKEPTKVIVDKQQMLALLSELNTCIYQIMEEYELTTRSRDKAEREFRKHSDQIIWDASRKAEDIYAASVMYMDEALNGIQDIMREANEAVSKIYTDMDNRMKKEARRVKGNQSELKSSLQNLVDTEKYLNLIDDRNKEIQRQKTAGKVVPKKEPSIYADRQTAIKVNQEYIDKLGLSSADTFDEAAARVPADVPKETLKENGTDAGLKIQVDLDADYFKWKERQGEAKAPAPRQAGNIPVNRKQTVSTQSVKNRLEGVPNVRLQGERPKGTGVSDNKTKSVREQSGTGTENAMPEGIQKMWQNLTGNKK